MAYTAYAQHAPKAPAGGFPTVFKPGPRRGFPANTNHPPRLPGAGAASTQRKAERVARAIARGMARTLPSAAVRFNPWIAAGALLVTVSPLAWQEAGWNAPEIPDLPEMLVGGGWYKAIDCTPPLRLDRWVSGDFNTCASSTVGSSNPGSWPDEAYLNNPSRDAFKRGWNTGTSWPAVFRPAEIWRRPAPTPETPPAYVRPPMPGNRPTPGILPDGAPGIIPASVPVPRPASVPAPRPASAPSPRPLVQPRRGFREFAWVMGRTWVSFRPNPRPVAPGQIGRNKPERSPAKEHKFSGAGRNMRAMFKAVAWAYENLDDAKDLWEAFIEAFDGDLGDKSFRDQIAALRDPATWRTFDPLAFVEGVVTWYAQEVFYGRIISGIEKKTGQNLGYLSEWGTGVNGRPSIGDPVSEFTGWLFS